MKKLVLLLAVAFSVSLFACNGAKSEAEATDSVAADTTPAVVEEPAATPDSLQSDSANAAVEAPATEAPAAE